MVFFCTQNDDPEMKPQMAKRDPQVCCPWPVPEIHKYSIPETILPVHRVNGCPLRLEHSRKMATARH